MGRAKAKSLCNDTEDGQITLEQGESNKKLQVLLMIEAYGGLLGRVAGGRWRRHMCRGRVVGR
jgi:hypothetical protein